MTFDLTLPDVGSVLLTGYQSNWQSGLLDDIAGQHLANGGIVVALVDASSDGRVREGALTNWCRASEVGLDALSNFAFVNNTRVYHIASDLAAQVRSKIKPLPHRPLLIIRDQGCDPLPLPLGASWLGVADELAALMACPVVTAAHHGPSGPPAPDYERFRADAVWSCTAGTGLRVTLKQHSPAPSTIDLQGRNERFGVITFHPTEAKGFGHAA